MVGLGRPLLLVLLAVPLRRGPFVESLLLAVLGLRHLVVLNKEGRGFGVPDGDGVLGRHSITV